ncbi:MAG: hypothetical protein EA422_14180 [Gemmatimonadales bacterium]|nr:MAG: hypothetical protein EA422_14180 [Gemmatimonadales bacterium]
MRFAERAAEPGYAARGAGERPAGVQALPDGGDSTSAGSVSNGSLSTNPRSTTVPPTEPAAAGSTSTGADRADSLANHSTATGSSPTDSAESQGRPDANAGQPPVHPGTDGPSLIDLLRTALSEEAWEAFSRGSAIRRAGRAGFARNVLVAVGNWISVMEDPTKALPAEAMVLLSEALADPAPLVRGHAAWALGRIPSAAARSELRRRASIEDDPWARAEITAALEGAGLRGTAE